MAPRTPAQIGDEYRRRRTRLRLTQDQIPGVSSATVRKIEKGTEPNPTERIRLHLAEALGWPDNAHELLAQGATASELLDEFDRVHRPGPAGGPIRLSASGVDLDELLDRDPEAYAAIMEQARIALDRARQRNT